MTSIFLLRNAISIRRIIYWWSDEYATRKYNVISIAWHSESSRKNRLFVVHTSSVSRNIRRKSCYLVNIFVSLFLLEYFPYILHTHTHTHIYGKKRSVFNLKGKLSNFAEIKFLSFFPFFWYFFRDECVPFFSDMAFRSRAILLSSWKLFSREDTHGYALSITFLYVTFTESRARDRRKNCVRCVSDLRILSHCSIVLEYLRARVEDWCEWCVDIPANHSYSRRPHNARIRVRGTYVFLPGRYARTPHACVCYLTRCYDVHYSMFFFYWVCIAQSICIRTYTCTSLLWRTEYFVTRGNLCVEQWRNLCKLYLIKMNLFLCSIFY